MEQGSTGLGEGSARARERKGPPSPIYSVELEVFEGPLDLLLHLVRKHELDILDIPIAFVAEKYLEYLDVMRQLDLEIAGDYLVMAATLAFLKSRELLPPEPRAGEAGEGEEEQGEDPREALIRRLVEYERFKQAAAELDALPVSGRDVFARGAELVMPPVDPGLAPVSLFNLAEAYYRVLTRAKVKSSHDVTIEPVTVAQRIQQLALMLDEKPSFDFEELFFGRTWNSEKELRQMLVVTLMSILEMVKLGVAGVQQPQDSPTIRIYRRATSAEAQHVLADYDEDKSFGAPTEPAGEAPSPAVEAVAPGRFVPEVDVDAVEEAALLAEALAAVQEPAEPVLDYADEDPTEAANDPRPRRARAETGREIAHGREDRTADEGAALDEDFEPAPGVAGTSSDVASATEDVLADIPVEASAPEAVLTDTLAADAEAVLTDVPEAAATEAEAVLADIPEAAATDAEDGSAGMPDDREADASECEIAVEAVPAGEGPDPSEIAAAIEISEAVEAAPEVEAPEPRAIAADADETPEAVEAVPEDEAPEPSELAADADETPEAVEAVPEDEAPEPSELAADSDETPKAVEAVPEGEAPEPMALAADSVETPETIEAVPVDEAPEPSEIAVEIPKTDEASETSEIAAAVGTPEPVEATRTDEASETSEIAAAVEPAEPVEAPEPGESASAVETPEPVDPQPVPQDSDDDNRDGGLFLNTGAGLGARELDADDDDEGSAW